jgi:NAD(P)H-dependent FMN reductase
MIKVGIIVGSTRPGRKAEAVGRWVHEIASKRDDAQYQLVDIESFNLPLLDEPAPPALNQYRKDHTRAWSAEISSLDAFVFITPEYNHSTSGALKNALDFLYQEWTNKAAGFVSYGSGNGLRAVEHLRGIMAQLQIADVRAQVGLSLFDDFENAAFRPRDLHIPGVSALLDQVVGWGAALKAYRDSRLSA